MNSTEKIILRFGVAVISLLGLVHVSLAQQRTCDLRLHVFEEKLAGKPGDSVRSVIMNQTNVLADAVAIARNTQTKTAFRGALVERAPYFRGIEEGIYLVTVSKEGYVSTKQTISLVCGENRPNFLICETVNLEKGSEADPDMPKKMRLDRLTMIGNSDGDDMNCDYPLPPPPKTIAGGFVNNRAVVLPKPVYPVQLSGKRESGHVNVIILIDTDGNVVKATPFSGNQVFYEAAVDAALATKFAPTKVAGELVKVSAFITFRFDPSN